MSEWAAEPFEKKNDELITFFHVGDEQLLKQNPNCAIIPLCGRTKDITILSTSYSY